MVDLKEERQKTIGILYEELRNCTDPKLKFAIAQSIEKLESSIFNEQKWEDEMDFKAAQLEIDKEKVETQKEIEEQKLEVEKESRKKTFWDKIVDVIRYVGPIAGGFIAGLTIFGLDNKQDKILSSNARNAFDSRKYK